MKLVTEEDFKCIDCKKSTLDSEGGKDYYMLTHGLWDKFGAGDEMLCMTCIESRLGRKLIKSDLLCCPLNNQINKYTSKLK